VLAEGVGVLAAAGHPRANERGSRDLAHPQVTIARATNAGPCKPRSSQPLGMDRDVPPILRQNESCVRTRTS
jgi:hypothetical protein